METEIRNLIERFEREEIAADFVISEIDRLTGRRLDERVLQNYWRAQSLDDFVFTLCTPEMADWRSMSDADAIVLIREVLDNPSDDAILERNCVALEKRYAKPSGTVSDLVFQDSLNDPEAILARLKVDTTIRL